MSRSALAPLLALGSVLVTALCPASASACSTGGGGNAVAYPPAGTTNVSPATTIFLASIFDDELAVLVDGAPLDGVSYVVIGNGLHDEDPNAETFRQLVFPQMSLPPGAHLEVRVRGNASPDAVSATSFDTAATSDATAGTPPVISALRLWRVQYPKSDFNTGKCVSSEFRSFLEADWTAAVIPNTGAASLVHVFTITPKAGGAAQSFVLGGTAKTLGLAPQGEDPFFLSTGWHPILDPGVEYCVSARAYGDGDQVRPALVSAPACAVAVELAVPITGGAGAGGAGAAGGMGGAGFGGGGASAGESASPGLCIEGQNPDGSCADGPRSTGGCTMGPLGRRDDAAAVVVVAGVLGLFARRRRPLARR